MLESVKSVGGLSVHRAEEHGTQRIPNALVFSALSDGTSWDVTQIGHRLCGNAPVLGDPTLTFVDVLQIAANVIRRYDNTECGSWVRFRDLRDRRDRVAVGLIDSESLQLTQ
jgi:hypothetical protein